MRQVQADAVRPNEALRHRSIKYASGQVVGDAEVGAAHEWHAFSWRPWQHVVDLGTLGGDRSHAFDVNDRGDVVGFSTTASGHEHAFAWNGTGHMRDLGTFGGTASRAWQINDYGLAVGQAMLPNQTFRAFAWTAGGGMVDLNRRLRRIPQGLVLNLALGVSGVGKIGHVLYRHPVFLRYGYRRQSPGHLDMGRRQQAATRDGQRTKRRRHGQRNAHLPRTRQVPRRDDRDRQHGPAGIRCYAVDGVRPLVQPIVRPLKESRDRSTKRCLPPGRRGIFLRAETSAPFRN